MASIVVFGIKNCNSVKKARRWLADKALAYDFHDFRDKGLTQNRLQAWINKAGWEVLLNRRGMTWRGLSEKDKSGIDEKSAVKLMLNNPTLIKRPVVECAGDVIVGFDAQTYKKRLP